MYRHHLFPISWCYCSSDRLEEGQVVELERNKYLDEKKKRIAELESRYVATTSLHVFKVVVLCFTTILIFYNLLKCFFNTCVNVDAWRPLPTVHFKCFMTQELNFRSTESRFVLRRRHRLKALTFSSC